MSQVDRLIRLVLMGLYAAAVLAQPMSPTLYAVVFLQAQNCCVPAVSFTVKNMDCQDASTTSAFGS